jgi:outer membrane protein
MKRSRVLWAASLLLAGVTARPQRASAQTLTLDEVEARAQRDRPELVERRASIDRANAELASVRAKTAPTLAARGELSLAPGGQLITFTDERTEEEYYVSGAKALGEPDALVPRPRYGALLAGKITLLDFGRTTLGVRAAESGILAERATLLQAKVELVRDARQAYLDWLEAHQTWQLAQRDAEVTTARTTSVRELILEGVRPATDATLSAYDEQLAKLREARARRAATLALEGLSAAIQSPLQAGSTPDLDVIEPPPGAAGNAQPAAPAPAGGPRDHGLEALDRQRDAALSAARAASRTRAPQLEAGAEVGIQGQDSQVFPAYRAGVSLSIPLFDGGAQAALADQHRAEALGLEARRQLLERKIASARRAAESALRAAGEELGMSLELLTTAETLLAEAEEHYRTGSDTLERVLSSQRSLVQARREVLTSKLENARARLELTPVVVRD